MQLFDIARIYNIAVWPICQMKAMSRSMSKKRLIPIG